ncbi:MAG: bifunctional glycosyltransferase family 2/GtrA family protein [Planctomycetales bacterium]|nr:bifunctional glycosyltransferase family 2/GtrA family protein [Planctomycetales bacterium]
MSIVIPCYNEQETLALCVAAVLRIANDELALELIIVDDASTDASLEIARDLARKHASINVLAHDKNQGKGAALRTGFRAATGDYVAVQDADLEYDPQDLLRLVVPLREGHADVVLGSRFRAGSSCRVLYFWHSVGNRFLTLLSNMFTDLNLTDMETCYKVFRRDVIQSIEICEDRFGFEPEVVAKVADLRCRIYEMGISYYGRTYEEGKKIGVKDGFRALYCIVRYNAHAAPLPVQLFSYAIVGVLSAIVNLVVFLALRRGGVTVGTSAIVAFGVAAVVNYAISTATLFRRRLKWGACAELALYASVVLVGAVLDVGVTVALTRIRFSDVFSKLMGSLCAVWGNYLGRRALVFGRIVRGPWKRSR